MSWSQVRGHETIVHSFEVAEKAKRLGHAYLFIGRPGIGKHTFARELAKTLLCEKRPPRFEACGTCPSCAMCTAKSHPDCILTGRPEDKVEFPIETIRELCEQLSFKPARGQRKVAIVDDAGELNETAANAFLKTLEEPAPGSMLILIGSASADSMISTIISRCQVVPFRPLSERLVRELLQGMELSAQGNLDRLVRISDGSPGQALSFDRPQLWEFRKKLIELITADRFEMLRLTNDWADFLEAEVGKEGPAKRRLSISIIQLIISMFHDALRLAAGVAPRVADEREALALGELAQRVSFEGLISRLNRALEAEYHFSRNLDMETVIDAYADSLAR